MTREHTQNEGWRAAEILLARLHIRTDPATTATVARVVQALDEAERPAPPIIDHDAAGLIGAELARQWSLLVKEGAPPPADDLVWADLVQFVLRKARAVAQERQARGLQP